MGIPKDIRRSKRVLIKELGKVTGHLRRMDAGVDMNRIAWMRIKGDLDMIEDPACISEMMDLLKKVNDHKRSRWRLEESIKQHFLHVMKRSGFLPSSSPEIDTLKINLPDALIRGRGDIWTYSYCHYINEIAGKVGKSVASAPSAEALLNEFGSKYGKEIQKLREDARTLVNELTSFRKRLKDYVGGKDTWGSIRSVENREKDLEIGNRFKIGPRRPYPLPRTPRRFFRKRLKRETYGPNTGKIR